ncbi:M16 family metallopeptidase [Melioribacteraceae bacterium 4301-Me]|uniref:M16 family metallopeptidase n=1 Tax=Pyranulibacter aquaticus TaxID=3163344 RepID=UPI003598B8EA
MEKVKITQIPNGITIVTEKLTHVKSFSLGFWFNVGSRNETSENNGISHFIEHMLFKGTKHRSAKKIAEEIESLGGYLNAFTSKEHTCFYGRGMSQHIEKTFEVIADMIQYPLFRPSDISKESSVVIDELYDIEDNPEELIFDKFESNIFSGSSLGLPIIGTEKNLKKFRQSDLFKYKDENYRLNNLFIVASGFVNHEDIVQYTKKYFKNSKKEKAKKSAEQFINNSFNISNDLYIYKETQQSHIIIGGTTYGYNDKRRIGVSVLSHILGEGSSSRLFQLVREKNGIAYQINTFLNSFYDISTFGVYFSTNDKYVEKAMNLVYSEFKKLMTKIVSEWELTKAKEYLIGNILMSLESTTNRMIRVGQSMIYFNRVKPINEIIKQIEKVTKEDILELSNQLFEEDKLKRVILSSKNLLLQKVA